jgi:hypothetical protein
MLSRRAAIDARSVYTEAYATLGLKLHLPGGQKVTLPTHAFITLRFTDQVPSFELQT